VGQTIWAAGIDLGKGAEKIYLIKREQTERGMKKNGNE